MGCECLPVPMSVDLIIVKIVLIHQSGGLNIREFISCYFISPHECLIGLNVTFDTFN